jgi:hypothetical protein
MIVDFLEIWWQVLALIIGSATHHPECLIVKIITIPHVEQV